jgi:hypothetical protein
VPRRAKFLFVAIVLALVISGCRRAETSTASSCALPERVALAVAGRADGVYGVIGDRVGEVPLSRFDQMVRLDDGVDRDSGKPWIRVRLQPEGSRALQAFTARPDGRSIVVVVGGSAASQHKIRKPLTADDQQVSCCNPTACARWKALVSTGAAF